MKTCELEAPATFPKAVRKHDRSLFHDTAVHVTQLSLASGGYTIDSANGGKLRTEGAYNMPEICG